MKHSIIKITRFYLEVAWNFPTLIIHELSHAFISLILGGGFSKIKIQVFFKENKIEGTCITNVFLDKRDALVSYAPIIIPIITLILIFIDPLIFGLILIYQWSTIKFLLPSEKDLENAKKTLTDPYWTILEKL